MKKPTFPLALVHFRAKRGCAFMLISTRTGKVRDLTHGKNCRSPVHFDAGAPTCCQKCGRRIYLQPIRLRQSLAIRCFDCYKIYCFRCVRRHFKLKCAPLDGGTWKKGERGGLRLAH